MAYHRKNFKNNYNKNYHQPYNNIFIPGIAVVVQFNNVDAALRKFKKKVQEEGILQTVRNKQEYIKPSEKRRKAKAAAKARHMKKLGLKP